MYVILSYCEWESGIKAFFEIKKNVENKSGLHFELNRIGVVQVTDFLLLRTLKKSVLIMLTKGALIEYNYTYDIYRCV